MPNIVNGLGQVKVGVRIQNAPSQSTLMTSIYSVYNAETTVTTLNTNVYAAYDANGNTNDELGNYNGTAVGGLTYTTGKIGNAFLSNGTNSLIRLPDGSLNLTQPFSVSFWGYITTSQTWARVIGTNDTVTSVPGTKGWAIFYTAGKTNIQIFGGTSSSYGASFTSQAITYNAWHHIVVNYNLGTGLELYFNGIKATGLNEDKRGGGTASLMPQYGTTSYATIMGSTYNNGSTYGNILPNGTRIDALTVWNKELTQDEITALYNSGNGLEYPYSASISVNSTSDALGNYNGTAMGGLTYGAGKIGQAFVGNGSNAYVTLPNNSMNSVLTGDFTVSLWVYLTSVSPGNQTIICNMANPSANIWNGWELRMFGAIPSFLMWNNASTPVRLDGSSLSINTWYNVVLSRKNGNRSRIYINSSLSNSNTSTANPLISGTFYPTIGVLRYNAVAQYYYTSNGSKVDAVSIWDKELTQDEVTELYNSGNGKQYPY